MNRAINGLVKRAVGFPFEGCPKLIDEFFSLRGCPTLLKICYLLFKVCLLSFQRCNLLRKQRNLLFQKVNYILAQSSGRGNPRDFLCSVDGAHGERNFSSADVTRNGCEIRPSKPRQLFARARPVRTLPPGSQNFVNNYISYKSRFKPDRLVRRRTRGHYCDLASLIAPERSGRVK